MANSKRSIAPLLGYRNEATMSGPIIQSPKMTMTLTKSEALGLYDNLHNIEMADGKEGLSKAEIQKVNDELKNKFQIQAKLGSKMPTSLTARNIADLKHRLFMAIQSTQAKFRDCNGDLDAPSSTLKACNQGPTEIPVIEIDGTLDEKNELTFSNKPIKDSKVNSMDEDLKRVLDSLTQQKKTKFRGDVDKGIQLLIEPFEK